MIKNKEKTKVIKIVENVYNKLDILNNITWTPYLNELFKKNLEDEKLHRKFGLGDRSNFESSKDCCALFFTVQQICEAFIEEKYTIKDYLHLKKSMFYAQSIVANYRNKIEEVLTLEEAKTIAEIDHMILYNYEHYLKSKEKQKEVA